LTMPESLSTLVQYIGPVGGITGMQWQCGVPTAILTGTS
jgi:hypothetical protein